MAENYHRIVVRELILAAKLPAQHRTHAQQVEERGSHTQSWQSLLFVVLRQFHIAPRVERHAGERGVLLAIILKVAPRHREFRLRLAALEQSDQLLWFAVRQWFEQHAVDDAENGRVRADTERERDHGDYSVVGRFQ